MCLECVLPCRYGPIAEVKLIMDRESGQCKGYGFVTFDREGDAKEAMHGLDDYK